MNVSTHLVSKTLYELYSIEHDTDKDNIKDLYKYIAIRYHPEINKLNNAAKDYYYIQQLYIILTEPIKRNIYNKTKSITAALDVGNVYHEACTLLLVTMIYSYLSMNIVIVNKKLMML